MAKRSRKVAAKYSELSKEGRKKERNRQSQQSRAAPAPRPQEPTVAAVKASPVSNVAVPKHKNAAGQSFGSFEYVRADLRTIGMLSGTVVLVLIVLTFVLG
jgi:hypothetical protein